MLPLTEKMRREIPNTLQTRFADDSASGGAANDNAACLNYIMEHWPQYRYFPIPEKWWYICKEADKPLARETFQRFTLPIQMNRGHNYLGGFIGSVATKDLWINDKTSIWTAAVETLSKITIKWPQTAYAGFTFFLQNEWQYVQRVVAGIRAQFAPLKRMIWDHFLPSLIEIPACEIDGDYQNVLTYSVKTGGIVVRNPCKTVEYALIT